MAFLQFLLGSATPRTGPSLDEVQLPAHKDSPLDLLKRAAPMAIEDPEARIQLRRFRKKQHLALAKYATTAPLIPPRMDISMGLRDLAAHPRVTSLWFEPEDIDMGPSEGSTPSSAVVLITDVLRMDDPTTGRIYNLGRLLVRVPADGAVLQAQLLLGSRHPYMRHEDLELSPIHGQLAELHAQGDFAGVVSVLMNYLETPNLEWPGLEVAPKIVPLEPEDLDLPLESEPVSFGRVARVGRVLGGIGRGCRDAFRTLSRERAPPA